MSGLVCIIVNLAGGHSFEVWVYDDAYMRVMPLIEGISILDFNERVKLEVPIFNSFQTFRSQCIPSSPYACFAIREEGSGFNFSFIRSEYYSQFFAGWKQSPVDSRSNLYRGSLSGVFDVYRYADWKRSKVNRASRRPDPSTLINQEILVGFIESSLRNIGLPFRVVSGASGLLGDVERNGRVYRRGNNSTPSGPPYRVLYAIVALAIGGFISFRFLLLGEDFFKPFLLNFILLFVAFVCCMYGFSVFLEIVMDKFG